MPDHPPARLLDAESDDELDEETEPGIDLDDDSVQPLAEKASRDEPLAEPELGD